MNPRLLMEARSTFFASGKPTSVRVFEDGVRLRQVHGPARITDRYVLYEEIYQVAIDQGLFFSELVIETGGGETLSAGGLSHRAARQAAGLIERLVFEEELGHGYGGGASPRPPSVDP